MARKLFVPAIGPVRPGRSRNVSRTGPSLTNSKFTPNQGYSDMNKMGKGISAAINAYGNLPPDVRSNIAEGVKGAVSGIVTNVKSSTDEPHSSGFALSRTPNPAITKLDTNVRPNTYTSDYGDAKENVCSPLHMSCALLQIPTNTSSKIYDSFIKNVVPDLQSNAQMNVSYNINLTDFSAANILTTFNSVLYALQIYFYYASINAYFDNPSNNNEGMVQLRNQITPQMIEDLYKLKRRLADIPFPPNLYELVRYLSTNYLTSTNQGSPMIKINPGLSNTLMMNGPDIVTALTNISTPTVVSVLILMRKAVPHWKIGEPKDVPVDPVYDSNFQTIFANLPFAYHNGTVAVNVPTVANSDATISYNSFTNTLDGMAFALTGVYDTALSNWNPGFITVPTTGTAITGNTRRSYYEVAGVKSFYPVKTYPFLLRSRQETYTVDDAVANVVSVHLSGADRCLNVNGSAISETSAIALDYLMTWDKFPQASTSDFGQENKFIPTTRKRRGMSNKRK